MDAFNQFKGGPSVSETPEQFQENSDLKKDKLVNMEFNGAGLYGTFNSPEINYEDETGSLLELKNDIEEGDNQNIDNIDISFENKLNLIQENKYFPIIKNLFQNELISENDLNLIVEHLYDTKDTDTNLDVSEIEGLDNYQYIQDYLDKVDEVDQNKSELLNKQDMFNDFPEFEERVTQGDGFDEAIFGIIGRNYMKLDSGNLEEKEANNFCLLTAIETATNKINISAKNIPKESQTYINAMRNIFSGDVTKALDGFESLYTLVFCHEGIAGAGMEKGKKALKQSLEKRLSYIKERIEIIEMQIESMNSSNEEYSKIEDELYELVNEQKEISTGDIFIAGEIDKIAESSSDKKEQTI